MQNIWSPSLYFFHNVDRFLLVTVYIQGVDYIKYDNCFNLGIKPEERYDLILHSRERESCSVNHPAESSFFISDIPQCVMHWMQLEDPFSTHSVNGNFWFCAEFGKEYIDREIIILLNPFDRGVDEPALWAGKVGNSWRTTDDINDSWVRSEDFWFAFLWFNTLCPI